MRKRTRSPVGLIKYPKSPGASVLPVVVEDEEGRSESGGTRSVKGP